MFVFPLLSTPCYIWDGVFIGLTAAKSMRNSMLLAFILFLGSFFLIGNNYGNHGLWLILLVFMVSRGLFQQILYWKKGIELT
jgi:MATE family multidrug resistance protein